MTEKLYNLLEVRNMFMAGVAKYAHWVDSDIYYEYQPNGHILRHCTANTEIRDIDSLDHQSREVEIINELPNLGRN